MICGSVFSLALRRAARLARLTMSPPRLAARPSSLSRAQARQAGACKEGVDSAGAVPLRFIAAMERIGSP